MHTLARNDPVGQVALFVHLETAKHRQIDMSTTNHAK